MQMLWRFTGLVGVIVGIYWLVSGAVPVSKSNDEHWFYIRGLLARLIAAAFIAVSVAVLWGLVPLSP